MGRETEEAEGAQREQGRSRPQLLRRPPPVRQPGALRTCGLAAPREWVQEAEGPKTMLGCQVAWCQGDVWRRMEVGGRRWGEEEGGCPSPRRRGWQDVVSVVMRHCGGRQEGGGGEEGFIPVDTSGLAQWTPGIRAAPPRTGALPLLRRARQVSTQ